MRFASAIPGRRRLLLALAWVAAPALSSQRYMPGAVDFEQPLPPLRAAATSRPASASARQRAPAAARSASARRVIVAPERFDLAGLAGELRPLELRARDSGGEWSELGRGRGRQPRLLRRRRRAPAPRPRVAARRDPALRQRLRDETPRHSSPTGDPPRSSPPASSPGRRGGGADRSSRGGAGAAARTAARRVRPAYGKVGGVIHHTVTANDYSEAEAPGIVLGICRYHRNANGWNDIGYQALVDRFGNLYQGRAGGMREGRRRRPGAGLQRADDRDLLDRHPHEGGADGGRRRARSSTTSPGSSPTHDLDAIGKTTMVSAGGDLSRYPSGRRVRLNEVIGHGPIGLTACPGRRAGRDHRPAPPPDPDADREYGGVRGAAARGRRGARRTTAPSAARYAGK